MSDLVQVATEDRLYLEGILANGDKTKSAVLYIHGFEGNFYQDNFSRVLLKEFEKNNRTFLTANNRGHEKDTDINTTDGKIIRIGAHYELLEDSPKDIDAWIEFLIKEGYKEIILAGHSLGTPKVVRYLFEGKYKDKVKKLILMCPFDKESLIRDYTKTPLKELIKKQKKKLKRARVKN